MTGLRERVAIALAMSLIVPIVACREHRAEVSPYDEFLAEEDVGVSLDTGAEEPTQAESTAVEDGAPTGGRAISHEWIRVYRVEGRKTTDHPLPVGFLHRRFSDEDPEGRTYVVDRLHVERGYILPDGHTVQFQLEGDEVVGSDALGNTGFDTGVKRLLGVVGGIEYEATDVDSEG